MALPIEVARYQTALSDKSMTRVEQINKWILDASVRGSSSVKFRSTQQEYETLKTVFEEKGYQVTFEIQKMPVVDLQDSFKESVVNMVYRTTEVLSVVIKW